MNTSAEFLTFSECYRLAKLGTRDPATRYRLETFERSFALLAKGAQLLAREDAAREAIEKQGE